MRDGSSLSTVDLSAGTVKRFLYEMAEVDIVERVQSERRNVERSLDWTGSRSG